MTPMLLQPGHLAVPKHLGHLPVPPQNGHGFKEPPDGRPPQAEHRPSLQWAAVPYFAQTNISPLPCADETSYHEHLPEPPHARQTSILP